MKLKLNWMLFLSVMELLSLVLCCFCFFKLKRKKKRKKEKRSKRGRKRKKYEYKENQNQNNRDYKNIRNFLEYLCMLLANHNYFHFLVPNIHYNLIVLYFIISCWLF